MIIESIAKGLNHRVKKHVLSWKKTIWLESFDHNLLPFEEKSFIAHYKNLVDRPPQCVECELYAANLPLSRIGIDVSAGDSSSFLEKKYPIKYVKLYINHTFL